MKYLLVLVYYLGVSQHGDLVQANIFDNKVTCEAVLITVANTSTYRIMDVVKYCEER